MVQDWTKSFRNLKQPNPPKAARFNEENKSTPRLIRRPAAFQKPDAKPPRINTSRNYSKIQPIPDVSDDHTKWGKTGFGRTGMSGES